jgi:hypothetical protein
MRSLVTRTILVGLLGSVSTRAQDGNYIVQAKQLFKAGATAYGTGDYLAAIQALESAYALSPLPAIAFSLAQAERRQYFVAHELEHLIRAVSLYRKYVDQSPNGARRADALEALIQLEPLLLSQGGTTLSGAPHEVRVASPTRLMITVDNPGARVSLDGAPVVASPVIREVKPGKHSIDITAKGYYSAHRDVVAVDGELIPVDTTLTKQPSGLVIWSPRDAEIYLDGALVGMGGDAVTLQFPSGSHHVTILQKGHRAWSRRFTLMPGEVSSARASLELSTQRYESRALLIAGGAALGAGLMLGALAKHAENSAQDFRARQTHHNVTSEELSQYTDSVRTRNQWRALSIASLASAGGLFVVGLLLYEFDFPTVGDRIHGEQPHKRQEATSMTTEKTNLVRIAPTVGGFWGMNLQATF